MEVINLNDIWYELESNQLDWDNSDIKYKFCVFFQIYKWYLKRLWYVC